MRPGFDPWVGKISWRRKQQPTPVLSPGESHGCRSLVGYSPWVTKSRTRPSDFTHFTSTLVTTIVSGRILPPRLSLLKFSKPVNMLEKETLHLCLGHRLWDEEMTLDHSDGYPVMTQGLQVRTMQSEDSTSLWAPSLEDGWRGQEPRNAGGL